MQLCTPWPRMQGEWVDAEHVPRDARTGRIKAYVARSGHGVYPRAGEPCVWLLPGGPPATGNTSCVMYLMCL
jgi:hypothetical protein